MAHQADLRAELRDLEDEPRELRVAAIADDWRSAKLEPRERALCAFAEKLTLHPADMLQADVDRLRVVGLDDRAVHDAVQVIAYFNYINRVADGLDVELEPEMPPRATGAP